MEILSINIMHAVVIFLKIFIVLAGVFIVGINYFHTKEARKMENKLQIALPGSVMHLMSFHALMSLVFVFVSTLFLFLL